MIRRKGPAAQGVGVRHHIRRCRTSFTCDRTRVLGLLTALTVGLGLEVVVPTAAAAGTGMPAPVRAGSTVYAERSVPGYAGPTDVRVRAIPGNGSPELGFGVPTPAGSRLLMGDWNGDGTSTPIVFGSGSWTVYESVVGVAPLATRQFLYGAGGDKPVVGDWNGDGRTDVGIVRGNLWHLRNTASAGRTWKIFRYGPSKATPVVGDWDQDGRDGAGVFVRGKWSLRNVTAAGARARRTTSRFGFGRAGDTPMTGDWNGDGRDTIGVVRGSTWHLRNTNSAGRATVKRKVRRPVGATPVAWRTLAGPSGSACPTGQAAVGRSGAVRYVRPSRVLGANARAVPASDTLATGMRATLLNAERYLLGEHYSTRWSSRRRQPYTDVLERTSRTEWGVRLPAMAALTVAVATSTGAHDPAQVGRSAADATQYADWLVRSIACGHLAVTPGGWGHRWQSAHWATLAGQAGWMMWDTLAPQTRAYVAEMLVSEADFMLTVPTTYWADRNGTIISAGDTKAEEDAWNSGFMELAVNMMPSHPRARAWREKSIDLAVASYATRADFTRPETDTVNGVAVAARLRGANAYDDYTVENHLRIHPDYMTNIQHNWWSGDFAGLAGRAVPQAAFFNAAELYGAMSTLAFPAGGAAPNGAAFFAPGGTIYQTGQLYPADVYYPQGSDWGPGRRAPMVSFDAHAAAYGLDSKSALRAEDALREHLAGQLAMQQANGPSGRTYSADPAVAATQDAYRGREEYAASQLASGWVARYLTYAVGPVPVDTGAYAIPTLRAPEQLGVPHLRGWRGLGSDAEQMSP